MVQAINIIMIEEKFTLALVYKLPFAAQCMTLKVLTWFRILIKSKRLGLNELTDE